MRTTETLGPLGNYGEHGWKKVTCLEVELPITVDVAQVSIQKCAEKTTNSQ